MNNHNITIFTDGSSLGNPGPGGWAAIIIFSSDVIELGGREDKTTNNRMELMAAISSLAFIKEREKKSNKITMRVDSKYVIQGITGWVHGWRKNGWMTAGKKEVLNRDLWEELYELQEDVKKTNEIEWVYTPGHSGIKGNERADEIAVSFAEKKELELYNGKFADYKIDILNLDTNAEMVTAKKNKKKSGSSAKAYSYLSLISGELQKHKTWADCEKRVKGAKGAKFKKALSESDEKAIIKEWGL